ncbi:hypothetical protein T4E_11561 [Trichinella pseudospiralis]|uniref:Uncharacterized protein n=1 Tax=Trichinella pseudospiralis TaxID=6337 RepID=A0A0V0XJK6_TRIPS|nr:hypothetical protein T4E_11561 [Trichinella pseudospiralis]
MMTNTLPPVVTKLNTKPTITMARKAAKPCGGDSSKVENASCVLFSTTVSTATAFAPSTTSLTFKLSSASLSFSNSSNTLIKKRNISPEL